MTLNELNKLIRPYLPNPREAGTNKVVLDLRGGWEYDKELARELMGSYRAPAIATEGRGGMSAVYTKVTADGKRLFKKAEEYAFRVGQAPAFWYRDRDKLYIEPSTYDAFTVDPHIKIIRLADIIPNDGMLFRYLENVRGY